MYVLIFLKIFFFGGGGGSQGTPPSSKWNTGIAYRTTYVCIHICRVYAMNICLPVARILWQPHRFVWHNYKSMKNFSKLREWIVSSPQKQADATLTVTQSFFLLSTDLCICATQIDVTVTNSGHNFLTLSPLWESASKTSIPPLTIIILYDCPLGRWEEWGSRRRWWMV